MMVRRTWSSCREEVSALPNSWNTATSPASRCSEGTPGFRRRSTVGNCLISSTLTEVGFSGWCETLKLRCPAGRQVSTPVPANLGQYRRPSKVRASRPWYRRSHLAILRYWVPHPPVLRVRFLTFLLPNPQIRAANYRLVSLCWFRCQNVFLSVQKHSSA